MKRKKSEEYEESQITTIYIFIGFKLYFAWKHSLKKSCLYLEILFTVLCAAGYLNHSNDTPKLNIHKYTNYNVIEIYINRLSTTTMIFIAMDYSIIMSEKYFHSRKRQKHLAKTFFPHPVEVNGSKHFLNYTLLRFLKDMYKNLKEIGIIETVSQLTIFVNLWISKLHSSLH